jgi:hypothetical protein
VCVPVKTASWMASLPSATATLIVHVQSGNASCQTDQNVRPVSKPSPAIPPGLLKVMSSPQHASQPSRSCVFQEGYASVPRARRRAEVGDLSDAVLCR